MTIKVKVLLTITILIGAYFGRNYWLETHGHTIKQSSVKADAQLQKLLAIGERTETAHYAISSTATPDQTALVSSAVESLYTAYGEFFKDRIGNNKNPAKLKLMLYKDRKEFSVYNQSSAWAEAYYREPVCHAYYSDGQPNPYHWMIHEVTHQLNNELAHFKIPQWINEGLATYFGTSKIEHGVLLPGNIDKNTYPIWWLSGFDLSGNLQADIGKGKIIPLRAIITGKGGPDINKQVNLYYIEYWSFTHFLFHYKNGVYAENYKELIVQGGSLEDFEKIIGPLDQIQAEWYEYLQQKIIAPEGSIETESNDSVSISL